MSNFTEKEFQEKKKFLSTTMLLSVYSHEKPFAVLTGGQPGAGKTTIARVYENKIQGDIVFVNGDDYRKRHPHFMEIYQRTGGDFATETSEFSGRMVEELIGVMADSRVNMIVEGTLRTSSVPNATRAFLQENGYQVTLAVMMVRPELSYLSTLKRYKLMLERGSAGRLTSKKDHDIVVDQIIQNLDKLYKENKFDNILLFNRDGEIVYDKSKTPKLNPADILKAEFNRRLKLNEKLDIAKQFTGYVSENEIRKSLRIRKSTIQIEKGVLLEK